MLRSFHVPGPCSEETVNTTLRRWISGIALHLDIDHVTLRRYLIDEAYLTREPDGRSYTVTPIGHGDVEFDPAVASIDPAAVIENARSRAVARRREQAPRQ